MGYIASLRFMSRLQTKPPVGEPTRFEHKWETRKHHTEDLLTVGESIKNKKAKATIAEISKIVGQWKTFAEDVRVESKLRDEIDNTLIQYK